MKKKKSIGMVIAIVLVTVLVIACEWLGIFSSPEYYKGLDWNTSARKLEWRLSKDHYWDDDDDCKCYVSNLYYPKEYTGTWCVENFRLDRKSGHLSEVNFYYTTKNSKEMNRVYDTEIRKLSNRLGNGTEYEWMDYIYTEWKGKKSTIRVIKNDYEHDDSNDAVEVVYIDNRECTDPYFTKIHLDKSTFEMMIDQFFCDTSPAYNAEQFDSNKGPDFSYFELIPTEETYKAVAVMNKHLFDEDPYGNAKIVLEVEGLSKQNPMTVEWLMEHPIRAYKLWYRLVGHSIEAGQSDAKDFLESKDIVDKEYEQLTEEEKKRA